MTVNYDSSEKIKNDSDQEVLLEFKRMQSFFNRNINSDYWDIIVEKLTSTQIFIISSIMKADTPNEINWLMIREGYYIMDIIRKMKK